MHILVPCKGLNTGKSRLSECLSTGERRAFCEDLLMHTLDQSLQIIEANSVHVVTSDKDALMIAARYGIRGITDPGGGLNAALDLARNRLLANDIHCDGILTLPIDLPFIRGDVITKAMAVAADVVIGPDEKRTGTNLLLLRGPALQRLPFAFGPNSYMVHVTAARSYGLTTVTLEDRRIAFDIDDAPRYKTWISQRTWRRRAPEVTSPSS